MKSLILLPFRLIALLTGSFSWVAPPWLRGLYGLVTSHVRVSLAILMLGIAAIAGYLYYDSLPGPVMVRAQLDPIQITPNAENASPGTLDIRFDYDFSKLKPQQPHPEGQPSVARLDLVGKQLSSGVTLSPAKKGSWSWVDDRSLRFVPETDWPAGTSYQVSFDATIFAPETVLAEQQYSTTTPALQADISQIELYQDPQDISLRRVVATVKLSHPVDEASLQQALAMSMRASDASISEQAKPYQFKLSFDRNFREAYIQSEPVTLPQHSSYMHLKLAKGVRSLLGGAPSDVELDSKVMIPDVYSFLKASATVDIVRNDKNEPEQVLMLAFTDDISDAELASKLSIYLLPESVSQRRWSSPAQISDSVLARSQKLDYQAIPNARNFSKAHNLRLDVAENRQLYIRIDPGLTSVNRFVHASFYSELLRLPAYPKEVNIAGEGSLLTWSGNHKLSVLTRGLTGLKYSIGRVQDDQLYHLISQTSGDISNPDFYSWNFNEQNLAQYETSLVQLQSAHPKQANYSSFDLSRYLPQQGKRFGLFFVDIKGYDLTRNTEIYGATDKRLILVTDLGVIVKNNADQSHDVFVQSVANGDPVAQARVELLGKNGVPVFSGKTDSLGHVSIPTTRSLSQEKTPTVYLVKSADDVSFIPFDRYSRQINLSRFDIGGVHSSSFNRDSLNAYVFTDRGIYRPGETVNLGMIVKNFDLSNVENIPLELVIRGPRNQEVRVEKYRLPKMGLADFQYPTTATSDTGRYQVSLHLVRDSRYRGREIGSASFRVEEFQPDTMKIQSRLLNVIDKGWNTDAKISARVTLGNLFGTPAQDRKMIARLNIQPTNFNFSQYPDYHFIDPYFDRQQAPLSLDTQLPEKLTDADGVVEFELDLSRFQQGSYRLNFTAEGFDQAGGRSVMAHNSTLISPLSMLIGYRADGKLDFINAKASRKIDFIAIDKTLQQQAAQDLTLKVIEIQNVSTLVRQPDGTYRYQTIKREVEQSSTELNIAQNGYQYALDTTQAGEFALEIVDSQQRRLSRVVYNVVGFANLAGRIDKNAELQLKLDKSDYQPGETIQMSIRAPYSGAGLITIETDHVEQYQWFKTSEQSSVQSIVIPEGLQGTGYVNVAFVRDVSSKEIFTSPLSYAVQPFTIDSSRHRVDIALHTADIVRPGKPMPIRFNTSKASRIALFAVDEGILQVAKYNTPDPLSHFLKKRALDVGTLQILDLLLPDFDIVKQLSASGGGADERQKALAKNLNPFARKTDRPAVFWSGIYDAGTEDQEVSFEVPDTFAGQLRVMAVAVAEDSVGAKQTSATVRGPFVITPNVLTQAAPGDEFQVTVGVANIIDGSGKGAKVDVSVSASSHLQLLGETSTQLSIDEGSEGKFSFRVRARAELGAAELSFTARHGNEESTRTTSLSVRPATPFYSTFASGYAEDGDVELTPSRQLYPDLAQQSVAASASPLVIVDGLSAYLESFPHGCTEQVVSKVFPLVGLMSHPAYGAEVKQAQRFFTHLIDKLRERQQGDGGFEFWPGHNRSANYPSIYVMHFLLEASEQGFPVPADMQQRGRDYLRDFAAQPATSLAQARDRANAIYLLTRMGEVTTNFVVDLEEDLRKNQADAWKQDILAVYMASTYQLLQKDQEAGRLIKGYRLGAEHGELDDFHSELTLDAQYIYLLAKHFESQVRALEGEQILRLTRRIFKGEYNTLSSAYSILALGAYSKLVLSNEFNEKISFTAQAADDQKQLLTAALAPFLKAQYPAHTRALQIEAKEALFYLDVQSGFDAVVPDAATREGIEVVRSFVDDKGNEVSEFEQGRELTVKLKVRALGGKSLTNIALIDLLPGGFEVVRSSVKRTVQGWRADYIDIREDRVVYYGDFDTSVRELSYRVKLTAAGEFVIPPSYAESMYDRSIRAISVAGKFRVHAAQ